MSNTDTTTTSNVLDIAGIEAERQVALAELSAATELLAKREAALEGATEKVETLEDALSGGDDSVTAAQLVNARAGVERAELLRDAARGRVKLAERKLPAVPELAVVVSEALAEHFPGIESVVVKAGSPVEPNGALQLRSSQKGASKTNPSGGTLSGTVLVTYLHTALHRELTADELQKALDGFGRIMHAEVEQVGSAGEDNVSHYRVSILSAFRDETPVLPNGVNLSTYHGPRCVGELHASQYSQSAGRQIGGITMAQQHVAGREVRYMPTWKDVAELGTDDQGRELVKVRTSMNVWAYDGVDLLTKRVAGTVEAERGIYVSGMGLCIASEVTVEANDHGGRVVNVSQVFAHRRAA